MWFGANATGLDSEATLALIARHAVGGYGWQQGTGSLDPGKNLGRGEVYLAEAATHLRDYLTAANNNSTLVFVYRQIQVALRLFAAPRAAADSPAYDDLWLRPGGPTASRCEAAQPWGTSDPFWNFSVPRATAYWVEEVVGELTDEAPYGVAAVFFDESDQNFCGYWAGHQGNCGPFSMTQLQGMQANNNNMLAQTTAALNAAGIIPLFSILNRYEASGAGLSLSAPCALPEDATAAAIGPNATWARFYENWPHSFWAPGSAADISAAMISNAIIEGAAGIPALIHVPAGTCPDSRGPITRPGRLGGPLESFIASFLIVQTEKTVFSASGNWYDAGARSTHG